MARPFLAVCGAAGTGKTTSVLTSFQGAYLILSAESNVHYYRKLLRRGKLPAHCKPPKRTKLIDTFQSGFSSEFEFLKPTDIKIQLNEQKRPIEQPQIEQLEGIILALLSKTAEAVAAGQPPPYANVVVDEFGEFLDRAFREILPTCVTKKDSIDTREAYVTTGLWLGKILGWLKQLVGYGVGVAIVMHDREPEGEKKGGPKAPSGSMTNELYQRVDGVIQRLMKDGNPGAENPEERKPRRFWNATAGERWNRKLRGLEPEDEDRIATMELHEILDLCDFEMS